MGQMAPQMPEAQPLPQSVSQMMPQEQAPQIPQPMPEQGMEDPLSNPAGISLQELLQLGINAYMSQLLQAPPNGGLNAQSTGTQAQSPSPTQGFQ